MSSGGGLASLRFPVRKTSFVVCSMGLGGTRTEAMFDSILCPVEADFVWNKFPVQHEFPFRHLFPFGHLFLSTPTKLPWTGTR
ncbi:hypothetical protein EJB05_52344 [Eragrostis curvula]|uniref:Uncharacterized protein n=1 Tax=Eragrostis curvula TaxID=38414 RepID=A0A5J9ST80_9POAL|nr:hypothetical protein EJB05_52344 [Eragrostis curvula]